MAAMPIRSVRRRALGVALLAAMVAAGWFAAGSLGGDADTRAERPDSSVLAGGPGEGGAEAPADADPGMPRDAWVQPEPIEVWNPGAAAGVLPGLVPAALPGRLLVAPGSEPAPAAAPALSVRVEAEEGLPIDVEAFAAFVMETLNDERGWGGDGSVTFSRTDGEADIRVVVASAATVDRMCAPLATNGKWSCGRYGHAALNADRWVYGASAFLDAGGGDLTSYRRYLVNHEVGHLLGRPHVSCPAPGAVAPVMLQQSLGLQGCLPNGWPNP